MIPAATLGAPAPVRVGAWSDPPPNIFSMAMATGIVSLAAGGAGMPFVATALLWLNALLYVGLWASFVARLARHPDRVRTDLRTHARAPGFFTMVASTSVLGSQFVALAGIDSLGVGLWFLASGLWFALTYRILPGLMAAAEKPPLEKGLNGGWLLTVVATQSICVLGTRIASGVSAHSGQLIMFIALNFWLVGAMLYLWLIALIFYRCLFLPLSPGDLTPPYWINMGAMAISTLAGVSLVRNAAILPFLVEILPFLKGLTLLFWATATWWIPLLLVLGFWRHLRQRYPLQYDHGYWAAVFPLGMYTVCTQGLRGEFGLSFLEPITTAFVWIAVGTWTVTAVALTVNLIKRVFAPSRLT